MVSKSLSKLVRKSVRTFGASLIGSLLFCLISVSIYGQSPESAKIERLEKELVAHFKAGKYKDALPIANELTGLNEIVYGQKSEKLAVSYTNLGLVYQSLEMFDNASTFLKRAVDLRDEVTPKKLDERVQLTGLLAFSQHKAKKYDDAGITYDKLIKLLEENSLDQSAAAFDFFLLAANNQSTLKDYPTANELYKRALKVSSLNFPENSPENERILLNRTCYLKSKLGMNKVKTLDEDYNNYLKEIYNSETAGGSDFQGRYIDFPSPKYPLVARRQGLSGTVYLLVRVNGEGKISHGEVICSNPVLGRAGLEAALKSKLMPKMKDGKPVETFGLMTYIFIAP